MADREPLPDEAWVVRCGVPPFKSRPLVKRCRKHPDGAFGFSVQAATGITVEILATARPNKSVGFTTVGEIRRMGYDVIRTHGDAHHATVVVPLDWSLEASDRLSLIFQEARNPSPKSRR
jgi:hypothetical protein